MKPLRKFAIGAALGLALAAGVLSVTAAPTPAAPAGVTADPGLAAPDQAFIYYD